MEIDKMSEVPLYHQLYEIIVRDIKSGIYEENEKLSSEREFCAEYKISRSTVRQTMSELEKDGYIYKEHGRGIFVSFEPFKQKLFDFYSFTEEMEAIGKIPSSQVLDFEIIKADKKIASKLKVNPKEQLYKFTRLRLADNEPIMLETTYLPFSFFPKLTKEMLAEQPMYDIFRNKYKVNFSKATEHFKSVTVRENEAKILNVSQKIPGMLVERYTYEKEDIIEYTISIARGDKFEYKVTLEN